ncbi:LOW QUALITY PROTEIN: hypothetical protein V2J09_003376 [Rumex salicifolius]
MGSTQTSGSHPISVIMNCNTASFGIRTKCPGGCRLSPSITTAFRCSIFERSSSPISPPFGSTTPRISAYSFAWICWFFTRFARIHWSAVAVVSVPAFKNSEQASTISSSFIFLLIFPPFCSSSSGTSRSSKESTRDGVVLGIIIPLSSESNERDDDVVDGFLDIKELSPPVSEHQFRDPWAEIEHLETPEGEEEAVMCGFDFADLTVAEAHETEEAKHGVSDVFDDVDWRFGVSESLYEDLKHPSSCGGERFGPRRMEDLRGQIPAKDSPLGFTLNIQRGELTTLVRHSGSGYKILQPNIAMEIISIYEPRVKPIRGRYKGKLMRVNFVSHITSGRCGRDCKDRKANNVHDFISGLKHGYDTWCGDECLDSQSDKVVQDSLERVMVRRTSIVVAHRLSMIQKRRGKVG